MNAFQVLDIFEEAEQERIEEYSDLPGDIQEALMRPTDKHSKFPSFPLADDELDPRIKKKQPVLDQTSLGRQRFMQILLHRLPGRVGGLWGWNTRRQLPSPINVHAPPVHYQYV
jgi:hypothetical protein